MKHFFIKQSKELQIEELYEKCGDHSLKLLFGLYRGSYGYLFLSLLFYVIKHSPAWILPIITAKVVDIAASGNQAEYGMIVWYLLIYGSDDHTESSNQPFTCPFPQSGDPTDRGGTAGRAGEKAAASVDPVS